MFATLAQWRYPDRNDIQKVVEIAAKFVPRDHLTEIPVGRRNEPNIHSMGAPASQALEPLLLQNPRELGL